MEYILENKIMLHGTGKAVLGSPLVGLALGNMLTLLQLAAEGEQNGCMVAPDILVCLPHMLHAVLLTDDALDLSTPGGNGNF